MINLKELRLGNWVYILDIGKCAQIKSIDSEGVTHHVMWGHVYADMIEPIPLTEEILLKCGFIKDNNGNYWIDLQTHYLELMSSNVYWYPVYAQTPEMSHQDEQRVSINRIQYVHELQNLFFAITGTELELKKDM